MDKINCKGISLLFVLAIMLLLMALGISALTAAGLSHRAVLQQEERNRFNLLVSSMERVMFDVLQNGDEIKKELFDHLYNLRILGNPGGIDTANDWVVEITADFADIPESDRPAWLNANNVTFTNTITVERWNVHFINAGESELDPTWVPDPSDPDDLPQWIRTVYTEAIASVDIIVNQVMQVNGNIRETTTTYRMLNVGFKENPALGYIGLSYAPLLNMFPIVFNDWTVINRDS
ncbi:MAG: hypothetical protein FWE90_06220 [Defluviitaleaceae bacterium]|nr:hypothetical protein [Defluviitaleaceae bacterium]